MHKGTEQDCTAFRWIGSAVLGGAPICFPNPDLWSYNKEERCWQCGVEGQYGAIWWETEHPALSGMWNVLLPSASPFNFACGVFTMEQAVQMVEEHAGFYDKVRKDTAVPLPPRKSLPAAG